MPVPEPPANTAPATADAVLAIAAALARELRPGAPPRAFALGDSLEREFGLDSLARVELVQRLEQSFGVVLGEGAFANAESPRDLLDLLCRAESARQDGPVLPLPALPVQVPGEILPNDVATLVDALDWHAAVHGDRISILLLADDASPCYLTYRDLQADARAVAAGLADRGERPGARVAIMLPTGRGFLAAFYGALYAGCIPVPLYPPTRMAQIEDHLRRIAGVVGSAGAHLLVTVDRAKPLVHLLRGGAPDLKAVVTPEDLARPDGLVPPVPRRAGDIAFLQYTSGSTGNPKGVVLTHANLLANIRAMGLAARADSSDVFVSWLPLYHDMGLIGAVLGSMVLGFRLVLMSPLAFLARPERWLRAIHEYRGTLSAAPNFAYELCAAKLADADLAGLDLSCWRLAFNGAEPVAAASLQRFAARLAPNGLSPGALTPVYGLAECSVGLAFPPLGRGPRIDRIDRRHLAELGEARPVAAGELAIVGAGLPLPGHEIRVVDRENRELPERRQGRVQFRGPSATSGYYHNPQATAELVVGDWRNTGDLGYLAGGELFITGREKDLIIRGGQNIHPQELEGAIGRLPGVRKGGVAVFAASDPRAGTEKLVAVVETDLAGDAERVALAAEVSRLALELTGGPADDVVLAPARTVRKTSSGKIRRASCRSLYESGDLIRPAVAPWRQFLRLGGEALGAVPRRWRRWLADWLFAGRAWGAALLILLLAGLPVLLLPGLSRRRRVARLAVRTGLRLAGLMPRCEGRSPAGGGIYVANHASYLDALVLTAVLPADVAFVGKQELAGVFGAGALLRRLGCHFVDRQDVARGVAGAGALVEAARRGDSLVFFAEGTFRRAPGLLPFRQGAFAVAAGAGRPAVPVTLTGTRTVLRDGTWRPQRGAIGVCLAEALVPTGNTWESAMALRDATRRAILARLDEPDLT